MSLKLLLLWLEQHALLLYISVSWDFASYFVALVVARLFSASLCITAYPGATSIYVLRRRLFAANFAFVQMDIMVALLCCIILIRANS